MYWHEYWGKISIRLCVYWALNTDVIRVWTGEEAAMLGYALLCIISEIGCRCTEWMETHAHNDYRFSFLSSLSVLYFTFRQYTQPYNVMDKCTAATDYWQKKFEWIRKSHTTSEKPHATWTKSNQAAGPITMNIMRYYTNTRTPTRFEPFSIFNNTSYMYFFCCGTFFVISFILETFSKWNFSITTTIYDSPTMRQCDNCKRYFGYEFIYLKFIVLPSVFVCNDWIWLE